MLWTLWTGKLYLEKVIFWGYNKRSMTHRYKKKIIRFWHMAWQLQPIPPNMSCLFLGSFFSYALAARAFFLAVTLMFMIIDSSESQKWEVECNTEELCRWRKTETPSLFLPFFYESQLVHNRSIFQIPWHHSASLFQVGIIIWVYVLWSLWSGRSDIN